MEQESLSAGTKVAIVVGLLFLVSAFKAWEDVRFRMSGKDTTARVATITEQRNKGRLVGYNVSYDFRNENSQKNVKGISLVDVDERDNFVPGQPLEIEYYGSDLFRSRLKGRSNWVWTALFVSSFVAFVAGMVIMTIQANRAETKPRRAARR
jgi:hypothetical protein